MRQNNTELATKIYNNTKFINDLINKSNNYKISIKNLNKIISQLSNKKLSLSNSDNENENKDNSENNFYIEYHKIPELSIKKIFKILINNGYK